MESSFPRASDLLPCRLPNPSGLQCLRSGLVDVLRWWVGSNNSGSSGGFFGFTTI